MNVGIFGGAFNPPHIAHLIIADTVRDHYNLDTVLWIPSYQPPHKRPETLISFEHRFTMTRLATQDNPGFEVSDIECRLGGVSYTVATLRALQEENPDIEYSLIIGGDSMQTFDSWSEPEEILDRVRLIVFNRPGYSLSNLKHYRSDRISIFEAPLLEISARNIRVRRKEGKSIRYLVPRPVYDYIEANGLYKNK